MHLDFAVIADYALVDQAGKLSVLGIFQHIWVQQFPAMHPRLHLAWDYPLGVVAPANFALHVNRYLHESPATREHMAMVAVKNHHHGVSNPKAQLRFEITVDAERKTSVPVTVSQLPAQPAGGQSLH